MLMVNPSDPDLYSEEPPRVEAPPVRMRVRIPTAVSLAVAVLVLAVTASLAVWEAPRPVLTISAFMGVALFGISILVAFGRALRGAFDLVHGDAPKGTLADTLGNLFVAGFGVLGSLISYASTLTFSRGRQLRRFGRVLLPDLRSNPEWTAAPVLLEGHTDLPAGLADRWRENGKTEHASVAAFARLTLDLMALGAPPTLVAAANHDALDEIRHAELCFSLARALDGKAVSPAPFPEAQRVSALPRARTLALAKLAVDSLVDGALHEGVSARIISALVRRCELPAVRAALKEIAADEGRHSAHGWAVVQWCLDTGGRPIAEALRGAVRALPKTMRSDLPEAASNGGWERWGIHGHELEAGEYAAALAHVTERVYAMTVARSATAA